MMNKYFEGRSTYIPEFESWHDMEDRTRNVAKETLIYWVECSRYVAPVYERWRLVERINTDSQFFIVNGALGGLIYSPKLSQKDNIINMATFLTLDGFDPDGRKVDAGSILTSISRHGESSIDHDLKSYAAMEADVLSRGYVFHREAVEYVNSIWNSYVSRYDDSPRVTTEESN